MSGQWNAMGKRGVQLGILSLLILLFARLAFALDPQKSLTQYIHTRWETEAGLPQNSVSAILQTRDGYLWVGTFAGLARFDGVRFTVFDRGNTPGIKNDGVWAMAEGRDGTLWIATSEGLTSYRNGQFNTYTTLDGLPHNLIYSLYVDREGILCIGTKGGLSRFQDGKFTNFTTREGLSSNTIRAIYQDRAGSLWLGTEGGGLNRFKDGAFTRYARQAGLTSDTILSIGEDRQGRLWVGTYGGGLLHQSGHRFIVPAAMRSLSRDSIYALTQDRSGNVWVGTEANGLIRLNDGKLTAFPANEGLAKALIRVIYEDREGSLWVGARSDGLNRLKDGKFTTYGLREGLSWNSVYPILEDREGALWIGTDGGGLNRFKEGRFTTYRVRDGLASDRVWSLFEDAEGSLWIGTENGLSRFRNGRFTTFTTKHGLTSNIVWAIQSDQEKSLWIGTDQGLNRWKDGKFTPVTRKDGLSNERVRYIQRDRTGALWIATSQGLNKWQDGKFVVYTTSDGLPHNIIKCIYEDADGTLWIGTSGGLARFRDGRFAAYTRKDGLFDEAIFQILEDSKGNVWMSSSRGPFQVRKQDLEDYSSGKIKSLISISYTKSDGLTSTQCNSGAQPMGYRTRDGRLWFPTTKGVAEIDPEHTNDEPAPMPVIIEQVMVDGRPLEREKFQLLPPGTRGVEFHYAGLSYLSPEGIRFKYRLEGHDQDWIDANSRRMAYYASLPPGDYRFRVMARNIDGRWTESAGDFHFMVQPYFYQTVWFYAFLIGGLGVLIICLYKYRVASLKGREQELSRVVDARTAELQQQKDFLRKVIDLNPSLIYAKDRNGRFTMANQALADIYGVSVEKMIGKTTLDLHKRREEAEYYHKIDLAVIASKNKKFYPELCFTNENGEQHWYQVFKLPILTPDGGVEQLLNVATGITLQKQAAIEMSKARDAAEAATRAKSEFLANMSHEIRTPMNAVIGMTDLLLDTPLSSDQKELVETIRTGGSALLEIINDILDFSKIESGKLDLEQAPFDLWTCVEESLDLLSARAAEKELELVYLIDERTPRTLVSDITRLRQILVNLLSNAIKFTHRGEVALLVDAKERQGESAEIHFAVRDTGIGIPSEKIGMLFQSFTQVDSSTTKLYGGTGLGLAISKRLTEMMGGRMWVESESGRGSTFHFTINVQTPETAPKNAILTSPDLGGRRVMIVDDNEANRELLAQQTRQWGMLPVAVRSGRECLDKLRSGERYSLVLIDLAMPEMDGLRLAHEIRRLVHAEELPLLLLSSIATTRKDLLGQPGADLFAGILAKPIKSAQLHRQILKALCGPAPLPSPEPLINAEPADATPPPLRLLLAEDNVINQKVALKILGKLGYQADIAGNGKEAIEALRKGWYDAVLMDVQMPEMDGMEATRHIRAEWPAGGPRIIAMTANAMQGDREACLAAGMDDYISKPVRAADLQAALDRIRGGAGGIDLPAN